jgi:hypothetical protein
MLSNAIKLISPILSGVIPNPIQQIETSIVYKETPSLPVDAYFAFILSL